LPPFILRAIVAATTMMNEKKWSIQNIHTSTGNRKSEIPCFERMREIIIERRKKKERNRSVHSPIAIHRPSFFIWTLKCDLPCNNGWLAIMIGFLASGMYLVASES
jgi:hypothetical protein